MVEGNVLRRGRRKRRLGEMSDTTPAPIEGAITNAPADCVLLFHGAGPREVLRIDLAGRIWWNGREVESDDDFRAAMLDVCHVLRAQR